MRHVTTSLFELFKIGPGPSSSHTIAPMRAGRDFLRRCRALPREALHLAERFEVRLLGSLSATGQGHGTDRAVIGGLLDYCPEHCPADLLSRLTRPEEPHRVDLGGREIPLQPGDIVFGAIHHDHPYANTMIFRLMGGEKILLEQEYYSVGGGFLQWKGWVAPETGNPEHPYSTMLDLRRALHRTGLPLHELILQNEQAVTGSSMPEVVEGLDRLVDVMLAAVDNGLNTEGVLPGSIGLNRKGPTLLLRACEKGIRDRFLLELNAYAVAAAEENATGHCVVTAPTAGASGVLPSVIKVMLDGFKLPRMAVRRGLMAAAAVGFLCKHNASIAGAEVGCQGEVGVASSMAAAMLAYGFGHDFRVAENAAEIALEHHLGLTCDPVEGLVQIPCIERNAMGAVKAYNAYLIAAAELPAHHVVDLDRAIHAMAETGRDMNTKYKETSRGGLAVSMVNC
ncbi:L-serine dehydratase [Paucidesulfovibrio gracilis DSM 16080]|uniref:L-serine dehydratase n=1 Tax=Paucidesulfovibrio gracilis DSM 16080 TaxID=1121449 RepID=A0A1T4XST9_9BACT|nr:L-serine ammonia-lyase [Paucidesulfovibrio gracilis]SKA92208.1 L-serine dehydratase [Paucidesulfovibrio gracilis DSM 16080]